MNEKVKIPFDLNTDGDCTNLCSLAILNIPTNRGDAKINDMIFPERRNHADKE